MVSAELGIKRSCPSCGTRFYDLLKNPIICPNCGVSFVAEALLPSKGEHAHAGPPPKVREREPVVAEAEPEDVELVSLEEVEEGGDEAADIEDVDMGEDPAPIEEDDTFLEEEEEEGNVSGILGGGKGGDEEDT